MKLNDIVADEKHGNGLLGLLIFLLVVGVTVGSVYLAKNSGAAGKIPRQRDRLPPPGLFFEKNSPCFRFPPVLQ